MALEFLGISGSLRAGSFNTASLRAAAALAPPGMTVTLADIGSIPLYDDDVRATGIPAPVEALRSRIAAADGVIFATPEYNYSVPGVLKNVIDWISRTEPQPLAKKPVGIIGASPGAFGTARAQYRPAEKLRLSRRLRHEQAGGHDRLRPHPLRCRGRADGPAHA